MAGEVTWRMPASRRPVLRVDAFARGQLALNSWELHPVFLLGRHGPPCVIGDIDVRP